MAGRAAGDDGRRIASLERWEQKDALGEKLAAATASLKADDEKSFTLVLKQPFGLVLDALAEPSNYAPFILPDASRGCPTVRPNSSRSARARSSSRRTSGSPATRTSMCAIPTMCRARSRPMASPAARWSRSTVSNG